MKVVRVFAIAFLLAVAALSLCAGFIAPDSYAQQYRNIPDAACSPAHLLGTDDLGRDRSSRLLYGTRVSLVLAPAAALLTTLLAGLIGGAAGTAGGRIERLFMAATDIFLSMPWLFLLIAVRALMPLNTRPFTSVAITFLLLGILGWAGAARVICSEIHVLRNSDVLLMARACGCGGSRLFFRQIFPNLKPVLAAQLWLSIPTFILAEANLGVLGLGVAEPLPSWGGLLRELEADSLASLQLPHFVPLILLVLTVSSFQIILRNQETPS
jgi:peptide/nickel transport system permease protein